MDSESITRAYDNAVIRCIESPTCIEALSNSQVSLPFHDNNGSVVQSTNSRVHISGEQITDNDVRAAIAFNPNAAVTLDNNLHYSYVITGSGVTASLNSRIKNPALQQFALYPSEITRYGDVTVTVSTAKFIKEIKKGGNAIGTLYSYLGTDHGGNSINPLDEDYVAAGDWMFVPTSTSHQYQSGAFIDTRRQYPKLSLASLSSSTDYYVSTITVTEDQHGNSSTVKIRALLVADFDDYTIIGKIRIDFHDEFWGESSYRMKLSEANITNTPGGFFTSTVNANEFLSNENVSNVGYWGGIFIGPGNSRPNKVAITFSGKFLAVAPDWTGLEDTIEFPFVSALIGPY